MLGMSGDQESHFPVAKQVTALKSFLFGFLRTNCHFDSSEH